MKMCFWFDELSREDVPIAGGKGANLGDMIQASLPIPFGFVVSAQAYRDMIAASGMGIEISTMLNNLDRSNINALKQGESDIRTLFDEFPIPDDLRHAILEAYRALGVNVPVAVRSSATAEDLAGASFAGQQDTFLNIVGEDALLNAVRRCQSSLFTSQAIFYRRRQGFNDSQVSMAVVVQKMIDCQKSGVTFTVEPVLRNRYQMVIECIWGLGEGIVSGTITPDHYKVDRETYEIIFEFIPEKKIMFCKDDKGGVRIIPVQGKQVSSPVLNSDELRQLVDLGNQVERHFGCPQDIEWGIEDGQIFLLQSRPITSL